MNTREQPNRGGSHVAKARPPRTRSIGVTLVGLLLVPLLALVALWAFLASTTLGNAVTELRYNREITADTATTTGLLIGLEQERLHTFLWLSSPRRPPASQLTAVRRADDAAIAAYERSPGQLQSAVLAMKQQLASISRIRAAADAGTLSAAAAFEGYSALPRGVV